MSIILKGKNGNELELAFVRESYPEIQDGLGDSAWCTVVWRAATAEESWEESAPCVNLFEFRNLSEWLRAVGRAEGADAPETGEVELLEPELKFSVAQQSPDGVGIRVSFHLDDRPEEFDVDGETDEAEYIDLFMRRESVLAAAEALGAEITDLERDNLKDDVAGERDAGVLGEPDADLNIIDRIEKDPPGAGRGVDNAGEE